MPCDLGFPSARRPHPNLLQQISPGRLASQRGTPRKGRDRRLGRTLRPACIQRHQMSHQVVEVASRLAEARRSAEEMESNKIERVEPKWANHRGTSSAASRKIASTIAGATGLSKCCSKPAVWLLAKSSMLD